MQYVDLAEIAYENKDIDLALKALLKLIKGDNSAAHIHKELVKWHGRFEELIADGYENPEVFYYQLIIERNYSEDIGIPLDYYYLHALKLIDEYPDLYVGYHLLPHTFMTMDNIKQPYLTSISWAKDIGMQHLGAVLSNVRT
ncbi:hypothetical protein KUH03_36775 [Sphingobacterium sp. E70]|uniref:hypothetical protein n=1 Tax=Sphingobacterium sp. E70 TaxID=2853439 RepID=UPI00211C8ED2|nr:hypothetical protein [Sphingobacterium sp. E70]ULT24471.1 hypothetical protein KUH03_36775 [Sphingobacterium sp. E70]